MKKVIKLLVRLFHSVFGLGFFRKVNFYKNLFYSEYVKLSFKKTGNAFFIERPMYLKNPGFITVGDKFFSHTRLRIETFKCDGVEPELIFGDNVAINFDCHIACADKIIIGNNVLIASRVFITDHFHGSATEADSLDIPPAQRPIFKKGRVWIDDNVWIGEGVTIMPNVHIGKNSVIGANSVVTKDVPANAVAAGVPAKTLRIIK